MALKILVQNKKLNIGRKMVSSIIKYKKFLILVVALATIAKAIIYYYNTKPIEEVHSISMNECLSLHKKCVKKVESIESCGYFRDYYIDLCEQFLYYCREGCFLSKEIENENK